MSNIAIRAVEVLDPGDPGFGEPVDISTAQGILAEQRRVYYRMTAGLIGVDEANRAAWQLRELIKTLELAELEARLERLERELGNVD